MKKIIPLILLVLNLSCHREYNHGFDAYFCTTTESENARYLYIDKEKIGELPYVGRAPGGEKLLSKKNSLYSNLRSGKHLVEVRDNKGRLLYASKIRANKQGSSTSISASTKKKSWQTRMKVKDECLVVEIIH